MVLNTNYVCRAKIGVIAAMISSNRWSPTVNHCIYSKLTRQHLFGAHSHFHDGSSSSATCTTCKLGYILTPFYIPSCLRLGDLNEPVVCDDRGHTQMIRRKSMITSRKIYADWINRRPKKIVSPRLISNFGEATLCTPNLLILTRVEMATRATKSGENLVQFACPSLELELLAA